MARLTLRRAWLLAHRWLGLSLGVVLLFSALTGSLLVVAEPLDRALHPELFEAPGPGAGPLEPVLQKLRDEFGARAPLRIRPPREPGESLQVMVGGAWKGTVFFDPASARELGRRGHAEGFFNLLFELHSELLAGDLGKNVLAAAALAYLLMLLSGLVLWWPARWRHAFTVKAGAGLSRALFDLHRVAGALLGALVLVAVASGAYMAWKPLSLAVTQLSGQAPRRPPPVVLSPGRPDLALDEALVRARAVFPEGLVGFVQPPASAQDSLRVRMRLPDDPHPNGLSSVWLHPQSGEVLAAHRWSELEAGTRAYSYLYPLHIGELGGTALRVATFTVGLVLCGYGISGLWLWWRRRQGRR